MKTAIVVASFSLITALSGLATAHAGGFNDRTALPEVVSTRTAPQDWNIPVVQSFNNRTALPEVVSTPSRARVTAGIHCDLAPRFGFQNSTSSAPC
jgi:hypothetical protein